MDGYGYAWMGFVLSDGMGVRVGVVRIRILRIVTMRCIVITL